MADLSTLTLGVFGNDPFAALEVELVAYDHPHPRARIRRWVRDRLRAAALEPNRIEVTRGSPTMLDEVPVVYVYTLQENPPELAQGAPPRNRRKGDVAIHVIVAEDNLPADVGIDDSLDAFLRVCELVILNDYTARGMLGDLCEMVELGATTIQTEDDGERLFIHARLELLVTYPDEWSTPQSGELARIHTDWDLGPPDGVIDARDIYFKPANGELSGTLGLVADFAGTVGP